MLALALSLPLTACDGSTGPDGGEARVLLSQSATGTSTLAPAFSAAFEGPLAAQVALGDVSAVEVTVTRVEALRASADENTESNWVALDVTSGGRINLLTLPTTPESGLQLARAELEPGTYGNLRLFFADATITFRRNVTLGSGAGARTFQANTPHPLLVRSGAQSGIKVPVASFTVAEDAASTVSVVLNTGASVQSVQVTGAGVQMSPVLTARGGGR